MISSSQACPASDQGGASAPTEQDSRSAAGRSFLTLDDAALALSLDAHVLRLWETRFRNPGALAQTDGPRAYTHHDLEVLRKLQNLTQVHNLSAREAIEAIASDDGCRPGLASAVGEPEQGAGGVSQASESGASVHELQQAVRNAVERGEFTARPQAAPPGPKARLERLLSELVDLKARLDIARAAH